MVQLMPLPLTVSCFSKIQIGFTFLLPAHPGSPEKGPLKGCVCILFEKYIHVLALETAGPGNQHRANQHRANCVGTLSFATKAAAADWQRTNFDEHERRLGSVELERLAVERLEVLVAEHGTRLGTDVLRTLPATTETLAVSQHETTTCFISVI